jgi:hypothetical protein
VGVPEALILRWPVRATLVLLGGYLGTTTLPSETVAVRYPEGVVRGFLALRSVDGDVLADGDLIQFSRGDRVTSRLVFHFKDGSIQDETAVYSESGRFRLLSSHLIQRGPSFPSPLELSVDVAAGRVKVRDLKGDGEEIADESMELPDDLANGMLFALLKNIPPGDASTTVSLLAATPKPRLVKLEITRAGEETFAVAGASHTATRFRVKVEIGGVTGLIAPLVGKQPPDTFVWILGGDAPGFVKSEGPLYQGGPTWRIELACPSWPRGSAEP